MAVLIDNRQKAYRITAKRIRQAAQVVLNALGCPDAELSVVLVDDPQIAELNRRYLNRRGPTNVIAFPMRAGEFADLNPGLLGDVVISLDTAAREARQARIRRQWRVQELLVHGILHLLGYDHETDAQAAEQMAAKSAEMMARIREAEAAGGPAAA